MDPLLERTTHLGRRAYLLEGKDELAEVLRFPLLLTLWQRVHDSIVESPEAHRIQHLHEIVEESLTDFDPAARRQQLDVSLQLRYLGVLGCLETMDVEIALAQLARQPLERPAADAEDRKAPGYLLVVSRVLVGVKGRGILLGRVLLIESADD